MKSNKNTEVVTTESKVELTKINSAEGAMGVGGFMKAFPENKTVPMVFFEDGMVEVKSPFTSIIDLSQSIQQNDTAVVQRFVDLGAINKLEEFMVARRKSIIAQFTARANFLSRSLALNLEQRIFSSIKENCDYNVYVCSQVETVTARIAGGFYRAVSSPAFSSTQEISDFLTTYAFNTTTIPGLVAEFYDLYDREITHSVAHVTSRKETAEEIHLRILNEIMPAFEIFKGQLEWLNYMLRSEAETIYRPMAMLPAEDIIEEHYQAEYKRIVDEMKEESDSVRTANYKVAITQALDACDTDKAEYLIKKAAKEGIDTGITVTTF